MGRRELRLREFPTPEKTTHIRLVKGVYSDNPGEVLCPALIESFCMKRGKGRRGGKVTRPKFLIRNFNNSTLELWQCKGCSNFLLRVEL